MNVRAASPATHFASPERRPAGDIARQVAVLENLSSLKPILDAVPDCLMVLNAERQILFGNKALRTLAESLHHECFEGMRPGEFLSCRNAATAPSGCGTSEACRTCGAMTAVLAALEGETATHECRISMQSGDALDFRVKASPLVWQGAEYVLVVLDDISDEKRRAVLERVFFHDVLNTAGGVQGLAHLIADDPSLCEGLKDDLLASSTSLVNEIKGQRLLLAAENDQLQAKLAPTRALHALEAVRHLYRNHPAAAGRRVELDRAAADALLETDETILQRVLGNMVKNALEAVSAGETVTLGVDVKDGACTFWCHNPGVIPPDARLQIFQRSFTTKGPGRGVGTYGIKLLAERYLHGTVGFSSSPEAGTRFHVTLPLR